MRECVSWKLVWERGRESLERWKPIIMQILDLRLSPTKNTKIVVEKNLRMKKIIIHIREKILNIFITIKDVLVTLCYGCMYAYLMLRTPPPPLSPACTQSFKNLPKFSKFSAKFTWLWLQRWEFMKENKKVREKKKTRSRPRNQPKKERFFFLGCFIGRELVFFLFSW